MPKRWNRRNAFMTHLKSCIDRLGIHLASENV